MFSNNNTFNLNKENGEEVWKSKASGIASTWGTPVIAEVDGKTQILILVPYEVWSLNPANGKLIWYSSATEDGSINTSLIPAGDFFIAMGERGGDGIRRRGRGVRFGCVLDCASATNLPCTQRIISCTRFVYRPFTRFFRRDGLSTARNLESFGPSLASCAATWRSYRVVWMENAPTDHGRTVVATCARCKRR